MSSDTWLPPEPGAAGTDVEGSVDVDADAAEDFAERVGPDPTQDEVAEYVEMQRQIEPPD